MKYPRLFAEISSQPWLITQEALDGIYKAISEGLTDEDWSLFHKASEGALDIFDGVSAENKTFVKDGAGYLFVDGPIIPRDITLSRASGFTSIQGLTRDYKQLVADPSVREIKMIADSPGGSVTGVSDFAQMFAASPKPTSVLNIGQMASAMYWIGAAANKVYSVDTGLSGSIGVIFKPAKFDGDAVVSSQSPNKWPDPSTRDGRAVVQARVDDLAEVMIGFIAKQREVDRETVINDFGRGGTLIAQRALEAGMIDGITTLSDFVASTQDVQTHMDRYGAETKREDQNEVSAGAPKQESRMTDKQRDSVDAPAVTTVDKDVVAEAVAKAMAEERNRLKAIEAVKQEFAQEDSRIFTAVSESIDKIKFDASTTVEAARMMALTVAYNTQKSLITEVQKPRQELATMLEDVPTRPKSEDEATDKSCIKAMREGFLGGTK